MHPDYCQCDSDGSLWYTAAQSPDEYEVDYFTTEYKTQYGRDYFEDRAALTSRMQKRWELCQHLLPESGSRLLEIGSSAGFFLNFFQQKGYLVQGWEISKSMVEYANQHGAPSKAGDLLSLYNTWRQGPREKFNIVAAFYVLEHIQDQVKAWQAIRDLCAPNGVLLLALPSIFGPTYLFDREKFYETHPNDHYIDYSVYSLQSVAARFNFELVQVAAEGIHPTRFPGASFPGMEAIYRELQHRLACSDTMFAVLKKR